MPKKGPLSVKRLEIEDLVGKFLKSKVAPNSREVSSERLQHSQSPSKATEEHKRHFSDMVSVINHTRTESKSKERELHSMNYSLNTSHKAPLISLDSGKKNDETGLFTFMYDQGIDQNKPEAQYALKEIINIQESYIKKRSLNIDSELLKNWRNKVFLLIFESKRNEILNIQKFNTLEKDKQKLIDELDNANYTRDKAVKEFEAIRNELNRRHHEYEHNKNKIASDNVTSIKTEITSLITSHANYFEEQEQKFNDCAFTLQSYHKRLQILQKRIKTYAHLVKSEQSSYVEKYKQLKKGIRNSQELENENDDLKDQIKRIKSLLEEKELNITSLNHQVKLEKGRI